MVREEPRINTSEPRPGCYDVFDYRDMNTITFFDREGNYTILMLFLILPPTIITIKV